MQVTIYPNDTAFVEDMVTIRVDDENHREMIIDRIPKTIDQSTFRCRSSRMGMRVVSFQKVDETEDHGTEIRMFVDVSDRGDCPCVISYHMAGISWSSSYMISIRGDVVDISSYVGITNDSGADIENARVHLISRNRDNRFVNYDISSDVSIKNGDTEYIQMFDVLNIPLSIRYVAPYDSDSVIISRSFINNLDSGIGLEMPPGDVKVYEEVDGNGNLIHIDSFKIPAISIGNIISLTERSCEDVSVDGEWDHHGTATIRVSNMTDEEIEIEVEERCPSDDLILESTHDFIRIDEETIAFLLTVPPRGISSFIYTIDPSLIDERMVYNSYEHVVGDH